MDFKTVRAKIEERRVLTGMSSYPFIIIKQANKYVAWFNYFFDEGDEIKVISTEGYLMGEDGAVEKKEIDISIALSVTEDEEPTIEYPEYLSEIEKLYDNYSEEEFKKLISQTEEGLLFPVYTEVAKQLS